MIIFTVLFLIASYAIDSSLTSVIANAAAVYSILTIVIFVLVALMFVQQARHWVWPGFVIVIILMVAVEVLAPYSNILTIMIASILAIIGLIFAKRPMVRYAKRNPDLPTWARCMLYII